MDSGGAGPDVAVAEVGDSVARGAVVEVALVAEEAALAVVAWGAAEVAARWEVDLAVVVANGARGWLKPRRTRIRGIHTWCSDLLQMTLCTSARSPAYSRLRSSSIHRCVSQQQVVEL